MKNNDAIATVMGIFEARGGDEYHGEAVSQLQHAVQAAEHARNLFPSDPEFILAAFLHDFGHICVEQSAESMMGQFGVVKHELVGADAVRALGFSEKTAQLVAAHVAAKRYLVSTDQAYLEALSPASKITLMHQGGVMTPVELAAFEADPLFEQHIMLRRIDEQAKSTEHTFESIEWIENLMQEVLN